MKKRKYNIKVKEKIVNDYPILEKAEWIDPETDKLTE